MMGVMLVETFVAELFLLFRSIAISIAKSNANSVALQQHRIFLVFSGVSGYDFVDFVIEKRRILVAKGVVYL